jgi:hypothetical protein
MKTLEDQLSPEKQEIFAAYRRKDITLKEAWRRLDAIDNPPPQTGWLAIVLVVAFLLGGTYAAVSRW